MSDTIIVTGDDGGVIIVANQQAAMFVSAAERGADGGGGGAVNSVNGHTGTVVLTTSDLGIPNITDSMRTELSDVMSTGLISGATLSINSSDHAKFDITSGTAVIVDNFSDGSAPTRYIVPIAAQVGVIDPHLATSDTVYVGVDIYGSLFFKEDIFNAHERRQYALIGWLDHVGRTQIEFASTEPALITGIGHSLQDFFYSFGSFNVMGNEYSANSALTIKRSAGKSFNPNQNYGNDRDEPHLITSNAQTPCPVFYYYRDGAEGWINDTPVQANLDPNYYDDGTGTLAAVPAGKFTIQTLSFYPFWESNDIQYGQGVYNTLAEAQAAISLPVENDPYNSVDVFRGWLIVKQGTTDLTDPTKALFVTASKLGGGSSGGGGGGTGEANTASNLSGSGVGVYDSKSGVDLQFRPINGGTLTTVSHVGNTVQIDVAVTKSDVGLGSVDNTSDVNKPVSTAQDTADGLRLLKTSNLSDLQSVSTARTNLGLATVASSGAYGDLSGTPTIPHAAITGTAILDFGSFPGSNTASVAVTGQTSILSTDIPSLTVDYLSFDSYTSEEVQFMASKISLSCLYPTNGVGFTIYGFSEEKLQGRVQIGWGY